jgi:predicted amidophosphoribosyltransferase
MMVLLVVAALFFGNCFSCPQMLLAWQSHRPAHNCCPHPGPQPASAGCQTQSMQHFVKAGDSAAQPLMVPVAAELVEAPASSVLANADLIVPAPAEHAPPGILSLRI